MEEVRIQPMTVEDYDDVRALWMTIRGFGIRTLDDSPADIRRFILRNPTTSVVARIGDRIVGSILCGRGIGTKMVGYCMQQLKLMGINKVSLIAFTANDAGNAFWNQIGWTRKTDVNYYEFVLNQENITQFIGDDADDQ